MVSLSGLAVFLLFHTATTLLIFFAQDSKKYVSNEIKLWHLIKKIFYRKRNQGIINLIVKWLRETFVFFVETQIRELFKNSQNISTHKICKSFNV